MAASRWRAKRRWHYAAHLLNLRATSGSPRLCALPRTEGVRVEAGSCRVGLRVSPALSHYRLRECPDAHRAIFDTGL